MDNIQVCPLCGIQKIGGHFRWSAEGNIASDDALYSKVCRNAVNAGKDVSQCLNKSGVYDRNLTWKPISQEFIDGMVNGASIAIQQIKN